MSVSNSEFGDLSWMKSKSRMGQSQKWSRSRDPKKPGNVDSVENSILIMIVFHQLEVSPPAAESRLGLHSYSSILIG